MRRVVLALCLVLGAVSVADAADVINGCYLKINGQFRVLIPPDRCTPAEVTVSLRSSTDTEGLNPDIYDAAGQYLGVSVGDMIYSPVLMKYFEIDTIEEYGDLWYAHLLFESADCTGQPYLEVEDIHWVLKAGGRYWTGGALAPDGVMIRSMTGDPGEGCRALGYDYDVPVKVLAEEIASLPFTTPVAFPTKLGAPKRGLAARVRRKR
jgi:hypothetical protein